MGANFYCQKGITNIKKERSRTNPTVLAEIGNNHCEIIVFQYRETGQWISLSTGVYGYGYIYIHICIYTSTPILYLCSLRGLRDWDIPTAMSIPVPRSWYPNIIPSVKGNRAPWRNGGYQGGGKESTR